MRNRQTDRRWDAKCQPCNIFSQRCDKVPWPLHLFTAQYVGCLLWGSTGLWPCVSSHPDSCLPRGCLLTHLFVLWGRNGDHKARTQWNGGDNYLMGVDGGEKREKRGALLWHRYMGGPWDRAGLYSRPSLSTHTHCGSHFIYFFFQNHPY